MTTQFEHTLLELIQTYRRALMQKPVGVNLTRAELLQKMDTRLPETGEDAETALQALLEGVAGGLVQSTHPAYFGFVIGGSTPASVAADWLTSLWDQNAQVYNTSPAASIFEEVVAGWVLDLLGLPEVCGVGFVTGAQMANFTALTVARNSVLTRSGWDMDADGLQGAPHLSVVVGEQCHATILSAVRLMGLGRNNVVKVGVDSQGRMDPSLLGQALENIQGPLIVCAQAGNVNSGAFDPFPEIAAIARQHQAWLHIDGAFGLWARVSPSLSKLTAGIEQADSWTVDAHKWLNVPYDSGLVLIRDQAAHQNLKTARCAYAGPQVNEARDGSQWTPENSRRARGFVLYAALRSLGRSGVRELIEKGCKNAQYFAQELNKIPHVRVLNQVVLNQVLFRIEPPNGQDGDALNQAIAAQLQQEGVCWMGTTQWQGQTALRISISNYLTGKDDINRSIKSLKRAVANGIHRGEDDPSTIH